MSDFQRIIEFNKLSIEFAENAYPELWFTARQHFPEIDAENLALMVSLATQICCSCHARPRGCHCWNDE